MKTIEQLESDYKFANAKRINIQNAIDELKAKEELPVNIAKYEGKYFKYRNSYSLPKKPSDYWFIYIYVSKVNFKRFYRGFSADGFTFERERDGNIEFKTKDVEMLLDTGSIEISKSAFDKALAKIMKEVNVMISKNYYKIIK